LVRTKILGRKKEIGASSDTTEAPLIRQCIENPTEVVSTG